MDLEKHQARGQLMLLPDLLGRAAMRSPDKLAAIFPGETATFAQLDRQSLAVAQHLRTMSIGPGSRVAIVYENSLAALVYYWGILRSGAATVDISPTAGAAALEALAEAQPLALALEPPLLRKMIAGDLPRLPPIILSTVEATKLADPLLATGRLFKALEAMVEPIGSAQPLPRPLPGSAAMCIYTSGTTGRPKGVVLSHENLSSNLSAFNSRIGLTERDSLLLVAPLHYIHGRIQLLTYTMLGATVVFASFRFPQRVVEALARNRVTTFSGVPYHFATLLKTTLLRSTPLPDLRHLIITGGALTRSQLRELQDAVPHAALHVNYGLTEASPRLTYHGPSQEVLARPASCGRPLPGVTIEILGAQDEPVPPGGIGEVVASGPGIMHGYVSGDERSSGRIDGRGRLRTGDLGYLDPNGYLYISGRSSDMIKTAGERLFPSEIERVLDTHPTVAESAVLGLPDALLGERVIACVVAAPGRVPNLTDLKRHCLKSLPYLRVPKEIHVVVELPKTPSGKVRREALRMSLASFCNAARFAGGVA
jgi:acyl-CoA synthetase (AMP-forming)/AMP-acid ligase II